jgi:hypothetical protein
MNPPDPFLQRAARWLAFGSAAPIVASIAASQILLALAFVALLFSGEKLRLPPIKLPLVIFMGGMVIAWLCSGGIREGLPQIRNFFVFCELITVFSSLRGPRLIKALFLTWAGLATVTAILGSVQFGQKVKQAHELDLNFYDYYVGEHITGLTSHWNAFSAEEMYAWIMSAASLFFGVKARRSWVMLLVIVACGYLALEKELAFH